MPLPQKQLKRLQIDLRNHDKERKELEAGGQTNRPDVRARINLHRTVLQVGRDPKILKALGELHDEPRIADQLASDPEAFAEARGIRLPAEATKIVVLSQAPVTVGVDFHIGDIDFRLTWSAESGFSISQLPGSE